MEEEFKYKSIPEKIGKNGHFWEVSEEGLFWAFRAKNWLFSQGERGYQKEIRKNVGWKLHISLADDGDNIEQAWDLIVDLLKEYRIKNCKVLAKNRHPLAFQWGKEITLYYQEDQAELVDWQSLLDEITARFIQSGIRPNCLAFNDMPVNGSSFFAIRNDEGKDGVYEVGLFAENFNPTDKKIPPEFEKITISHTGQPARKKRKCEAVLKEFYRNLLDGVLDCSQLFMRTICPLSPYLNELDKDLRVWDYDNLIVENICFELHPSVRGGVRVMVNDIKEMYKVQTDDLCDKEEKEILKLKKYYLQKIKLVENALNELPDEINAAIKAEEDLALMAAAVSNPSSTGNSGDNSRESKSDSSKSSSKEGSPREPDSGEKPNFG